MELYLIRHGQSFNNTLLDASGRMSDPPLTETGERQAELVAEHLSNASAKCLYGRKDREEGYGITRLFCSAMLRCLQTSEPIGEALGLEPEIWIDVHEECGIWLEDEESLAGMTRGEISSRFPKVKIPEAIGDEGWWNGPKETESEWLARAGRVTKALTEDVASWDERVAVVTHGGFTKDLLQALLGVGKNGVSFSTQNTSIGRLDILDGVVNIRYLNRTEHLPPDLVI